MVRHAPLVLGVTPRSELAWTSSDFLAVCRVSLIGWLVQAAR